MILHHIPYIQPRKTKEKKALIFSSTRNPKKIVKSRSILIREKISRRRNHIYGEYENKLKANPNLKNQRAKTHFP